MAEKHPINRDAAILQALFGEWGEQIVKLDKLVKTLRREIVANPAKAGVLGVLLLGGTYFWGPLAWKWVGGKKSDAAGTAAVVLPVASAPDQQGVSVAEQNEIKLDWREIRQRREKDPLTRAADFQLPWNQAFFAAKVADTAQSQEAEEPVKPPAIVDPGKLGLVLEGVVIGSKTRKAIISGKVYREQDQVKVSQSTEANHQPDAKQPDVVFRLMQVSRKMVKLERDGKTWSLEMKGKESGTQLIEQAQMPQSASESPTRQGDPSQ